MARPLSGTAAATPARAADRDSVAGPRPKTAPRSAWPLRLATRALAALLLAAAGPAHADADADADKQIQFFLENDILARSDRYYTNGFKVGFGKPTYAWIGRITDALLDTLPSNGDGDQTGWFIGQNMYTPKNIGIAQAQPDDRPWGAWAYLGAVAQRAHKEGGQVDRIDTVELDIGATGPAALGEQVQKTVHGLTKSRTPMGWHNQGPSEAAVMLAFLRKWKVAGNDYFDVIPHAGATVGTVMTLARAGAVARLGYRLSGFGVDTIEPGGAILQSTRTAHLNGARGDCEAYAFAGVDQRLVLYNSFLDGPVFHHDPRVDRRPHVYDVVVGASVRIGWFRLSLTRVRRSEEFTTAAGGGGSQIFHSFNIGGEW